jgi:hypothetical protein
MVPTRMQIDLTIRATYLGPLRPQTTYTAEEWTTADTVPMGEAIAKYQFDYAEVDNATQNPGTIPSVDESGTNVGAGSGVARADALTYAINHVIPTGSGDSGKRPATKTKYNKDNRNANMIIVDGKSIFDYVDCSSLVVRSYIAVGAAKGMGWNSGTWTGDMVKQAQNPATFPGQVRECSFENLTNWAQKGDLLLRPAGYNGKKDGHVSFFGETVGNTFTNFAAHSSGSTPQVGWGQGNTASANYKYILRPEPTGWTSQVNNTGHNPPL